MDIVPKDEMNEGNAIQKSLPSEGQHTMTIPKDSVNVSVMHRDVTTTAACTSLSGPFTCSGCAATLDTSCSLHAHMAEHSDGSYHYDHVLKTAFPKFDSSCTGTQTTKMDKSYLKRYSRSRTGKPPTRVHNVKMKSEVRENFILLNADDPDQQSPIEEDYEIEQKLTIDSSSSPYPFRTTTRFNRSNLRDCFLQLDSFKTLETANNVDKVKQNRSGRNKTYTHIQKEPGNVHTGSSVATRVNVDLIKTKNIKCETSADSDSDPDYAPSLLDNDSSDDDLQRSVNVELARDYEDSTSGRSQSITMKTAQVAELENTELESTAATDIQQPVKRKRGRPRKVMEGDCITTNNDIDLISDKTYSTITMADETPLTTEVKRENIETPISESENGITVTDIQTTKRKRGRPRKIKDGECDTTDTDKHNSRLDNSDTVNAAHNGKPGKQYLEDMVDAIENLPDEPTVKKSKKKKKKKMEKKEKKDKTFVCHICGQKIWTARKEVHMNKHTNVRPYVCDVCAKAFYCRGHLTIHMKYHDKDRGIARFRCSICEKVFVFHHEFTRHMYSHSGEKPFKCEQCDATFISQCYLKKHTYRVHAKIKKVSCSECDRMFFSISSMKQHCIVNHAEPTLPCRYCRRFFSIEKVRRNHELTHTGEKVYYCSVCNHGFIQWSPYLGHMMKQHGFTREHVLEMKKIKKQQSKPSKQNIILSPQEIDKILQESKPDFQKPQSKPSTSDSIVSSGESPDLLLQSQPQTGLQENVTTMNMHR